MTGGDQREPLWASSLARQPERPDDVVAWWEHDEDDEKPAPPAPPETPRPVSRLALAAGMFAAIGLFALASALPLGADLSVSDVPSYWNDIDMTCHTSRFEQGDRAIELFSCRATGGGELPPGLYRSPRSRWTSDITRREALANRITITPDGEMTGWAAY